MAETLSPPKQKRLETFVSQLLASRPGKQATPNDQNHHSVNHDESSLPPRTREYLREVLIRDQKKVRELKALYKGCCQISGKKPVGGLVGNITEVHHIQWLTRGGLDTRANMVVLSPNMHAAVHLASTRFDRQNLTFVIGGKAYPLKLNKHLQKK